MKTYKSRYLGNNWRINWYNDEDYETEGNYALDTAEETAEAERQELEKLASGELVALGAVAYQRCNDCPCPSCDRWHETESLWGIVIEPNDQKMDEFAKHCFELD